MLTEALTALAAASGSAVVQAAGTDAWATLRQRAAQLISRGNSGRERVELERLDRTASELDEACDEAAGCARIRQESAWRTRFEILFEALDEAEQQHVAAELQRLITDLGLSPATEVSPTGGIYAGRDVSIRAEGGIAAGVIHGGAHLHSPPTRPSQD
jgi:hypothetical protein